MKLLFVGDIMFERKLKEAIFQGKNPLEHVQEKLRSYDLVIANLETSFETKRKGKPLPKKPYHLRSPLESLSVLQEANIEVVNLANNHTMDFGPKALVQELKELDKRGIKHFGAGKKIAEAFSPLYVNIENTCLAFLGFNRVETYRTKAGEKTPGQATFKQTDLMQQAVTETRKDTDLLFVLPHWGKEYSFEPSEKQQFFATKFIDWGADMVIGTHPHVVQPHVEYNGKPIFYSIGNFCFCSQNPHPGTLEGMALEVEIKDKKIVKFTPHKILLQECSVPYFE